MSFEGLFDQLQPEYLAVLAGGALVLFGRHLYLLLLAVVGFTLGWWLTAGLGLETDGSVSLVVGTVFGLAAAVMALFLQRVVLAVAGFLIGAVLALWVLQSWLPGAGPGGWLAVGVAGVVSALLLPNLFETALMVLSTMVGAALVVQGLTRLGVMASEHTPWLFLGLVLFGVLYQSRAGDRSRRRRQGDDD